MNRLAAAAGAGVRLAQERFSRASRPREPEPMVMDNEESVAAFHTAHSVLQVPTYRLNAMALSALLPEGGSLLDLGSGTGRLLAHLAEAREDVAITGTDLAPNMLSLGRKWLDAAGLGHRISLREADMTDLPEEIPRNVDVVSCIWALHHLPTPDHVRFCLSEIRKIQAMSDCAVWIFDFARFRRAETFPAMLRTVSDVPPRLLEDGIASERAAWSDAELRSWVQESGLTNLTGGRERRVGWCQVYLSRPHDREGGHARNWAAPPLGRAGEREVDRLRKGLPTLPPGI